MSHVLLYPFLLLTYKSLAANSRRRPRGWLPLQICAHCGYGGSLSSLLAANADYLVDALCARLRDLQRYPQTPHLLAALLRRAGVAPQLLPLMAEPLQRTLQVCGTLLTVGICTHPLCWLSGYSERT